MIRAVNDAFREVDVLLCASSLDPACRIDDAAEVARTYSRQCRMPFNVTGHPALAMMSGLSRDGLPLSVQFVGRSTRTRCCCVSPPPTNRPLRGGTSARNWLPDRSRLCRMTCTT